MEAQQHLNRFERLICEIFAELGEFEIVSKPAEEKTNIDVKLVSKPSGPSYRFHVKVRERITPQIAVDLFERFQREKLPDRVVRIIYAPVISPRVAEIARQFDVSFVDYAGNCRIVDSASGLLISRSGIPNEASSRSPKNADPFSPKSSRIVRAMLHEPQRGWQVSELSEHPDVGVSLGLASRIKQVLVRENYAVVRDRLLFLKQPVELLEAWVRNYAGPPGRHQYYVRGETEAIERSIAAWCEKSEIEYALAQFSAAWRHAPEVRYSVASFYLSPEAFSPRRLESLRIACGAQEVESGANLVLLTPFDKSVFVRRLPAHERATSPLQTWLDLHSMAGRGPEAAEAVFETHLREALASAAEREGSE